MRLISLIQSRPMCHRYALVLVGLMTLGFVASAAQQASAAPAPRQPLQPASAMKERMRACTACHGKEGVATNEGYFPRIAGKPAGYLYNQLRHFREGRRQNPAMQHLLQHMSDEYLQEIARYFSELDLPYPPPQVSAASPDVLARGEQLVRQGRRGNQHGNEQGNQQGDLPACTACHGSAMTGRLPSTPGLLGLPRDYVVAQLGAWRAGTRKADAPDCMAHVARRLSREDIHAVSLWLAAQPVPERGHPAAPDRQTTGIRCKDDPK